MLFFRLFYSCCLARLGLVRRSGWLLSAELNKNTDSGFSAGLVDDNNPFEWQVILSGPPETI